MKTQPRPDSFVVRTKIGNEISSRVWADSAPLAIGTPFRFVLERLDEGVRVRDLQGGVYQISDEEIARGAQVELFNKQASVPCPAFLSVKRAQPITPSYLSTPSNTQSLPQLFAYAGVRRSLLACSPVHSAYVAYERGKPAFAAYQESDGVRIKALASGLRIKFKGEAPQLVEVGKDIVLSKQESASATLFRHWYWWRFVLVQTPGAVEANSRVEDDDSKLFKLLSLLLGAVLIALFAVVQMLPPIEKQKVDKPTAVVIKLEKKEKVFLKPKPKAETGKAAAGLTSQTKPKDAAPGTGSQKKETPPPAAAAVQKVAEPKPVPKVAVKPTHAPAPAHPGTQKIHKTPSKISRPVEKAPMKPAAPDPNAISKAALNKAKSLKSALSGIKALTSKTSFDAADAPGDAATLFNTSTGSIAGEVGGTEVKPTMAGSSLEVQGIGGKGAGKGAGYGDVGNAGAGLGKGAGTGSGGGSYVSLGKEGYRVEEGLTKEEVGTVIHNHMGEVRYCHEAALLENPRNEGKLMVTFQIDPKGHVTTANIDSSSLTGNSLANCVVTHLKTWKFPKPRGGVSVTVSYPFLFRILERD
jgi:TonB family protein